MQLSIWEYCHQYPQAALAELSSGPLWFNPIPYPCTFSGVYLVLASPQNLVSSYLTVAPWPCRDTPAACLYMVVYISVALSSHLRALRITKQPALWSPDFPHFFIPEKSLQDFSLPITWHKMYK